jgi:hypothetical protein
VVLAILETSFGKPVLTAAAPALPVSEPHEEFPGLFINPVPTGPGIRHVVRMPSFEGAEFHGISIHTPREFSGNMCAAGCQGYGRRSSTFVVIDVVQDAIFPPLFGRIAVDPFTRTVIRAGRLIIRNGFLGVGREIDVPIGRGIGGDRAQLFLMICRERVGYHRAVAEAAAENSRGIDAKVFFKQFEHVIEENMVFIISYPPRRIVSVSLGRNENAGDISTSR